MKTYTIKAAIEEVVSDELEYPRGEGLPERFGHFQTREAAEDVVRKLWIEAEPTPWAEELRDCQPLPDELEEIPADTDLFEALTYAIACSKQVHEGLHAFEARKPNATCAQAIVELASTAASLLPALTEMIDRAREGGRPWTNLPLEDKDRGLREAFQTVPALHNDFAPISTVWWEPLWETGQLTPTPSDGCPAWVSLWERTVPGILAVEQPRLENGPRDITVDDGPFNEGSGVVDARAKPHEIRADASNGAGDRT